MKAKALILTAAAVFMLNTAAAASQDINVSLNGEIVSFSSQKPVVLNGRTLIPLRGVFDKMGYTISWNANTKTVSLADGTNDINVIIGESCLHVNGKTVPTDVPASIINGSTMLPLRAVADATGAEVKWDASSKLVSIVYSNPYAKSGSGVVMTYNSRELDYINAYSSAFEAFNPVISNFSTICTDFTSHDMGDSEQLKRFAQPAQNVRDAALNTVSKLNSIDCPPRFSDLNRTTVEYAQAIADHAAIIVQRAKGEISAEECVERYNASLTQTAAKAVEHKKAFEAVLASNK